MANVIYPYFKTSLLNGGIDQTGLFCAFLLDGADETYNAALETIDDLVSAPVAQLADPGLNHAQFETDSIWPGPQTVLTFDSDDFAWPSVTGDICEVVLLYHNNGGAYPPIAWYDEDIAGFPVTPNGGDINCTVHERGWFQI
jgi:hypothetical protein